MFYALLTLKTLVILVIYLTIYKVCCRCRYITNNMHPKSKWDKFCSKKVVPKMGFYDSLILNFVVSLHLYVPSIKYLFWGIYCEQKTDILDDRKWLQKHTIFNLKILCCFKINLFLLNPNDDVSVYCLYMYMENASHITI